MPTIDDLLEIREYGNLGYAPVVDFNSWRVAILNCADELLPHNLHTMQRHNETDEVFVLLQGRCILFIGAGDAEVTQIYAQDLAPGKVYNVKRAVWHTHALSKDAKVLIVENRDTTAVNSPRIALGKAQHAELMDLTRRLWNGGES